MAESEGGLFSLSRRGLFRSAARLAVAASVPNLVVSTQAATVVREVAGPLLPSLTKLVAPFICYDPGSSFYNLATCQEYAGIIAQPPNHGANVGKVISDFCRLKNIGYACKTIASQTFSAASIADFVSPEWAGLEAELLPLIKPGDKPDYYSKTRLDFAAIFQEMGIPSTTSIAQAVADIEQRCVASVHAIIRHSYQCDPMALVNKFHSDGENLGLKLHQFNIGTNEYFGKWIPREIAAHIEATFPFSSWAKGWKLTTPTGLAGRLFPAGVDAEGHALLHLALSVPNAKKALVVLLGEVANDISLRPAKGGGAMLALGAEQYEVVGERLAAIAIPELAFKKPTFPVKSNHVSGPVVAL